MMCKVSVVYASPDRHHWLALELGEGCSVEDAIRLSGILERYPELDLAAQKVGIFGKFTQLDTPIKNGDRIEIYRPIIADPKTVKRRQIEES